jgi:hypothetical protein
MPTIVEYSTTNPPQNQYPDRIISPPRSRPCCLTHMETIGTPQVDGRWIYQYKRCRRCGFAVRSILEVLPDLEIVASLQATFSEISVRGIG